MSQLAIHTVGARRTTSTGVGFFDRKSSSDSVGGKSSGNCVLMTHPFQFEFCGLTNPFVSDSTLFAFIKLCFGEFQVDTPFEL